jgi:hypothetical protein
MMIDHYHPQDDEPRGPLSGQQILVILTGAIAAWTFVLYILSWALS